MTLAYNEDNSDQWKNDLHKKAIEILLGNNSNENYEQIGYAYLCYAQNYIYKYFPDDIDRFDAIKENKMRYSAPINFNDVFDCDFSEDFESIFNSVLKQAPYGTIIRKNSKKWIELRGTIKKALALFHQTMDLCRETMGVTCFSESDDSLLMWAHYAHNHRGICVEYDLHSFNTQLKYSPIPVVYSEKKPYLSSIDFSNPQKGALELFFTGLTTKSVEWSYEKEWRIIRDEKACGNKWNKETKSALLPSTRPISIILGCASSREFEAEVRSYCENSRINLYKMHKDETEYRLKKELILQFDKETE